MKRWSDALRSATVTLLHYFFGATPVPSGPLVREFFVTMARLMTSFRKCSFTFINVAVCLTSHEVLHVLGFFRLLIPRR